jgi:hypothetical protein
MWQTETENMRRERECSKPAGDARALLIFQTGALEPGKVSAAQAERDRMGIEEMRRKREREREMRIECVGEY